MSDLEVRELKRTGVFAERVSVAGSCWEWTGGISSEGYGRISMNGRDGYAHRLAYEQYVGPIPQGLEIDHLCRNRRCCNPAHLEAVTRRENIRRGMGPSGLAMRQETCAKGHPFSPENTYTPARGGRVCRACKRERDARYYAQRRGVPVGVPHGQKTHCPYGHEYSPENTYVTNAGARRCRACGRRRAAEYYRNRRASAGRGAT